MGDAITQTKLRGQVLEGLTARREAQPGGKSLAPSKAEAALGFRKKRTTSERLSAKRLLGA